MNQEILHFTRKGVLMHAVYTQLQGRNGAYWLRDTRTESVCICVEREEDRKALLGIAVNDAVTLIGIILDGKTVYQRREW